MLLEQPFRTALSLWYYLIKESAYNKRKLYTKPINPETSTRENPINAHRTKLLLINGFRAMLNKRAENIKPTPIPTPANTIKGILDAK